MIRLGHVNIHTPRLEETVAFYTEVLGLSATDAATRPGSPDHVWLVDGGGSATVHVQRTNEPLGAAAEAGLHHIAFDCENADRWRAQLASLGIDYSESDFPQARMAQINLRDPNGLRLELTFRA